MQSYEYKAIPAPGRAKPVKGMRGADERFALTISEAINTESAKGWEYMRADTLPAQERSLLGARKAASHCMLFFRRPLDAQPTAAQPAPPRFQASRQSAAPLPDEPRLRSVQAKRKPAPTGD